jgi:hypothetical protein
MACAGTPKQPQPTEKPQPTATEHTNTQPAGPQEVPPPSTPAAQQTRTATTSQLRLSWQEFSKDPKRVASLRKAIAVMKERNKADRNSKEYRTSWEYWANTHGYFGPQAPMSGPLKDYLDYSKQVGSYNPKYFEGLTDQVPPNDGITVNVWDSCKHGDPSTGQGDPDFFPWHRWYLFYFERVLRAAAGDDTLRLPYWDYTDPNHTKMPAEFTTPTYKNSLNQDVPNPLYESRRLSQQVQLDPRRTNINDWLGKSDFASFETGIEFNVHAAVHCTVTPCPQPLMGAVPVSSNDPIFWIHHANIDRIWACWLAAGNSNPEGDLLTHSFNYVDENGNLVTPTVQGLFEPGSIIDYSYDHVTDCGRPVPPTDIRVAAASVPEANAEKARPPSEQKRMNVGTTQGIQISSAVVKVPLKIEGGPKAQLLRDTLKAAPQPAAPQSVELVLEGMEYKLHPGSMFDIFLEKKSNPSQRVYVGTLSFFAAPLAPGKGKQHGGHHHGATTMRRTFDVSDEMRELVGPGLNTGDIQVVFEATTGEAGSTPERAKAFFNPKRSDFRVKSIELHVTQ